MEAGDDTLEFSVEFRKSPDSGLGISVSRHRRTLQIEEILEGPIADWNRRYPRLASTVGT